MRILGLMSGTSLDGVDLALCRFANDNDSYTYEIEAAETFPYPKNLGYRLSTALELSAPELAQLHFSLSVFFSEIIARFLQNKPRPGYIASHGHTVFHSPEQGYTLQIGNGGVLAQLTGIPVVCDFRSGDVALGGQGAPLVPAGDKLLFSAYAASVNLGGIANLSYDAEDGQRRGFDICPCNMVLNRLAGTMGMPYDKDGDIARGGQLNTDLLLWLNNLPFYREQGARSLGAEWVNKNIFMYLKEHDTETFMRSFTEHIALRTGNALKAVQGSRVLFSGGGVHNRFLMERIQANTDKECIVPDAQTADFKEALLFAFLGYLYLLDKNNILSSVTGAARDSIGGALYKV